MRLLLLSLSLCAGAALDAQLNAPKIGAVPIGMVLYPDGNIHAVRGLSADLIVDKQPIASATAIAFSDSGGLIAAPGQISLVRTDLSAIAVYPTTENTPLLHIENGLSSAVAWLPAASALLYSDGVSLTSVEVRDAALSTHVTSVHRESPQTASLLVSGPGGSVSKVVVSLKTGNTLSTDLLPGVHAPAFAEKSFILFPTENSLEILALNGNSRAIPLPAARTLRDLHAASMSSGWLHLYSASLHQSWVLHLTDSDLRLSELPGRSAQFADATLAETSK